MRFLLKYKKLLIFILVVILYMISISYKSIVLNSSGIFVLMIFAYMSKSALNNVGDCIYYLVFIAPILGVGLSQVLIKNRIIEDTFVNEILLISIGYILIWILVVSLGQIKVAKMATLILAQVSTASFLIGSYILNLVPIYDLNNYFATLQNFELLKGLYGYDSRKFVEIAIQSLTYPIIVSALLTYLIAEYRDSKHNGQFLNH